MDLAPYEFIELPLGHAGLSAQRQQPARQAFLSAAMPCLVWVTASNGLIVLNKFLMSADGFRYPMALSSIGMIASWLLSAAAVTLGVVPARNRVSASYFVTRFLPVGAAMSLMFYCGNRAYLYSDLLARIELAPPLQAPHCSRGHRAVAASSTTLQQQHHRPDTRSSPSWLRPSANCVRQSRCRSCRCSRPRRLW